MKGVIKMGNEFKALKPELINDNVFKLIGSDWMLVTAGTVGKFNAMTASWGGFGYLWNKNICICVVRPNRYTFEFIEKAADFTLSFFEEKYRDVLSFYGTNSGRDVDKMKGTGITAQEGADGTVHFQEAKLYLECRKIYFQDLDPKNFIDPKIATNYSAGDYHRMYIGEITGCFSKE